MKAAWLGHWKAPWPFDRGRRWGDTPWALAALAQAWMLGGREGRWPCAAWEARRGTGPWPAEAPRRVAPRPEGAFVALLRHGSPRADPRRPGPREDPHAAWAWEALLEGDASPCLALGSVWLDLEERLRWVALLGAETLEGHLLLPPFLEALVPEPARALPQGWWSALLGCMDPTGRLLPEGAPPGDADLRALLAEDCLAPLLLQEVPPGLGPSSPHLHALPGGTWMLNPALRAWGRGLGAGPEALRALIPPGLACGGAPDARLGAILQGRLPESGLPEGWKAPLARDLAQGPHPAALLPSGDPSLDRLAVRWGGPLPAQAEGCAPWGAKAHPCADPFHWMAEGQRSLRAADIEGALRAFGWAHAHFRRLDSPFWAQRAAANAAQMALFWADPEALAHWQREGGPQPSPYREYNEALLRATKGDLESADRLMARVRELAPELEGAWMYLGERGAVEGREDWIRAALPQLRHAAFRLFLEAALEDFRAPCPEGFEPELALTWHLRRTLDGREAPEGFWAAWETCPNHCLRLARGLVLLEAHPETRLPSRLLGLQALARRSGHPGDQARVAALWPTSPVEDAQAPEARLRAWLEARPTPAWLVFGERGLLGPRPGPPEALLARVREAGALPPLELEGRLWWGMPLAWQGAPVGAALLALDPGAPIEPPGDLPLLAPWVAALAVTRPAPPEPSEGAFLADGSEPMASLLAELARVAPSELPVLILGPTGSGKELLARELHRQSARYGPLVAVNCSAFAEGLLESELFGHVKGAFTGADRTRSGAIEAAEGGTLFLDEVADLSPRLQSLFLRVLQEKELRKVGDSRSVKVDVRFAAATHKDLEGLAAAGAFRRDLLYRLQGAVLRLPSLQERRHELPFLLPRLVARLASERGRMAPGLAPGLAQALARLPWPGNLRELVHALERAMLRCGAGPLTPGHFPELMGASAQEHRWTEATAAFQRRLLMETLQRHAFRVTETAAALGLTRPALYATAKRLGVDVVAERMERAGEESLRPG